MTHDELIDSLVSLKAFLCALDTGDYETGVLREHIFTVIECKEALSTLHTYNPETHRPMPLEPTEEIIGEGIKILLREVAIPESVEWAVPAIIADIYKAMLSTED
jgi:hypothetical protein